MVLAGRTKLRVSKNFFRGYLFVFVEYLCNCSPKIKTKNIKNYSSTLAIVNQRNWLNDSPPLITWSSTSSYHMLDPVFSPSTELAGFRMVIVFTIPRHFVRSHASSFPSPFFFISFSTYFFHVCFGLPLPLQLFTSNFKAFTITFSSSFLKT